MIMKKLLIGVSILLSGALASCSDWLDVTPEDQIAEEQLYEQAQGYYNQLNGVYFNMSSQNLYGRDMTWGFMDILAQYYDTNYTLNDYGQIAGLDYERERVKVYFERFWSEMYNQIANCNNLIQNIEVADVNLFPGKIKEKNCIEGEARALRAMLHFDLLRMYAPSMKEDTNGKHIPYVDYFPTHVTQPMATSEMIDHIEADLLKAHDLTFKQDSMSLMIFDLANRLELRGNSNLNRFFCHRGYHLNHYAIKALLARVYMWEGDKENAMKWAQEIIKLIDDRKIRFTSEYHARRKHNVKLYGDVLFAGYNNHLIRIEKQTNTDEYMFVAADYEGIFGNDADDDSRRFHWNYDSDNDTYRAVKYEEQDDEYTEGKVNNMMIPLIRTSEMFYIYAECIYDQNPEKAREMLQYMRSNRNCRTELAPDHSKEEFIKLVENEYRREFYGEGQLFFFYKRLGLNAPFTSSQNVIYGDKFVFPIPESEDI